MYKLIIPIVLIIISVSIYFNNPESVVSNLHFELIKDSNQTKLKNYLSQGDTVGDTDQYLQLNDNEYLYTHNGVKIPPGVYYINLQQKYSKRILDGYPNQIEFIKLKDENTVQYIKKSTYGMSYPECTKLDIQIKNGKIIEEELLSYNNDMEPGVVNKLRFELIKDSNQTKLKDFLSQGDTIDAGDKYLLLKGNEYLYTHYGVKIPSGVYYINLERKCSKRILNGYPNQIKFIKFKDKNTIQYIKKSDHGRGGRGYTEFTQLNIQIKNGKTIQKKLLSYNYDMESGLCGRAFLGLKLAGEVDKYNVIYKGNDIFVQFHVKEQTCATKSIVKKIIDIEIE